MFILDEQLSAESSESRVSQCWGQVCRGGRISLRPKETLTSVTGVLSGQQSVRTLGRQNCRQSPLKSQGTSGSILA